MDKMKDVALLAGRVLLALMFVMAGWSKNRRVCRYPGLYGSDGRAGLYVAAGDPT